jgi:hypothetical protein
MHPPLTKAISASPSSSTSCPLQRDENPAAQMEGAVGSNSSSHEVPLEPWSLTTQNRVHPDDVVDWDRASSGMGLGLVMIGVHAGAGFCVDDEGGGVGFGLSDARDCGCQHRRG